MKLKPPVFVVGSPRSGTTWLYHLLLSSGGFAIYRFETHVFNSLAPATGNFRRREEREKFLRRYVRSEYFLRTGLQAEGFRAKILDDCDSAGDFLRILMDSIAADQGAERWAECTPDSVLYMAQIKQSFPDARFLHIVRDGRDVALSLMKQEAIRPFKWGPKPDLVAAALFWEWIVGKGVDNQHAVAPNYMEVRYGDLVLRPREVLATISEFIGHDMDYDRIQRAGIGSVSKPNTSYNTELYQGSFNPVDRWKTTYSREELRLIEALIGPFLERLGFELGIPADKRSPAVLTKATRSLYRARFSSRTWLKSRTPLGRWFTDTHLLDHREEVDDSDESLRPALHKEYIRTLIAGIE